MTDRLGIDTHGHAEPDTPSREQWLTSAVFALSDAIHYLDETAAALENAAARTLAAQSRLAANDLEHLISCIQPLLDRNNA